jgi:hypothetical protein
VRQDAHQTPYLDLKGKPNAEEVLNALAQTGLSVEQLRKEMGAAIESKKKKREKGQEEA